MNHLRIQNNKRFYIRFLERLICEGIIYITAFAVLFIIIVPLKISLIVVILYYTIYIINRYKESLIFITEIIIDNNEIEIIYLIKDNEHKILIERSKFRYSFYFASNYYKNLKDYICFYEEDKIKIKQYVMIGI